MTFQETSIQNLSVAIILACFVAVLGAASIVQGILLARRTTVSPRLRARWQQYVSTMLGPGLLEAFDDEAVRSAEQQWLRMQGGTMLGFGIGTLAGLAGVAALMLAVLNAPFGLPLGVLPLLFAPMYWGTIFGSTFGGVGASRRRVRGAYDDGLTDGEPPRHVSDYRSPLLVLLVVALPFVVFSALTLILAPRFVAFPPTIAREYGIISPPRWIVAIYPCVALVTLILAEICVWMKVKLVAAIKLRDAVLARRLHMGITGQFVGMTYWQAMFLSTIMGMAVIQLFSLALNGVGFAVCMGIFVVLAAVSLGMTFLASRGRLGGRLTGWPWGNGAAASAEG